MRALFEDKTYSNMAATFSVDEVALPAGTDYPIGAGSCANRVDLWFRSVEGTPFTIYAYATRAEAITTPPPSTYLASATVAAPCVLSEITFTDNAATNPDMTGLKAVVSLSVSQQPRLGVWGYTCTPHLVAADNIRTILLEYVAVGRALDDFDKFDAAGSAVGYAAEHIKVGHPVQAHVFPFIAIRPMSWRLAGSGWTGGLISAQYPIEVYIISGGFGNPFDEYAQNQKYLGAVESILADERRTGMGEVLVLARESARDPDMADYDGMRWQSQLSLIAEFNAIWRDDQYPRP